MITVDKAIQSDKKPKTEFLLNIFDVLRFENSSF